MKLGIKGTVIAVASAAVVLGTGLGVAEASVTPVFHPVHVKPVPCETLDLGFRTQTGHEANDVFRLCGKDMPTVGISCLLPSGNLPAPNTTLTCGVTDTKGNRK